MNTAAATTATLVRAMGSKRIHIAKAGLNAFGQHETQCKSGASSNTLIRVAGATVTCPSCKKLAG